MASRWIDVTMPFGHPGGTWPGDAPFLAEWTARLHPDGVNLSRFASSPHNGTHSDAPFHVDEDGGLSETLPIENFLGPCVVLDATKASPPLPASLAEAAPDATRILFKTRTVGPPAAFDRGYKGLSGELAEALASRRVRLVGTDAPSVDPWGQEGFRAHRALFGVGASLIENLDLSAASPGRYELVALPLRVAGLCAAPVRALLRRA